MRLSRIGPCLAGTVMFLSAGPVSADPDCTCRYRGAYYAVSTCVCIDTGEGPRLACCGMVLNNTSLTVNNLQVPETVWVTVLGN